MRLGKWSFEFYRAGGNQRVPLALDRAVEKVVSFCPTSLRIELQIVQFFKGAMVGKSNVLRCSFDRLNLSRVD